MPAADALNPAHGRARAGVNPGRRSRAPGSRGCSTTGGTSWRRATCRAGRAIDGVSRWLLITRACVFSMTITSALIGGLLAAATAPSADWGYFALALARAGARARRQQHDQRLVRHRRRRRHERVHARALRAASAALGPDLEEAACSRHRRREPRRSRDPARAHVGARLAGASRSPWPASSSASSTSRRRSS